MSLDDAARFVAVQQLIEEVKKIPEDAEIVVIVKSYIDNQSDIEVMTVGVGQLTQLIGIIESAKISVFLNSTR